MIKENIKKSEIINYIFGCIVIIHIITCPYTKVEESFNIQAIHDHLNYFTSFEQYDHKLYPGVVPRTFLGSIVIALLTYPFYYIFNIFQMTKITGLYISRIILGLLSVITLRNLMNSVKLKYGENQAFWFMLICCCQFHLPYYASRTLPNTFACIITNISLSYFIQEKYLQSLIPMTFGIICFRCELSLLMLGILLYIIFNQKLSIFKIITIGISTSITSLFITISIDSILWNYWLWPEGEVFWFNTILNKSVNWGTQPFHWYFTSALPRSLLLSFPIFILSFIFKKQKTQHLTFLAIFYIILYSNLAHKEVRFIFPVIPLFNIISGCTIHSITTRLKSSDIYIYIIKLLLFMSFLCSCLMLIISSYNYPGANALITLHQSLEYSQYFKFSSNSSFNSNLSVHIDVLPAMSGISRFLELNDPWSYSKIENLNSNELKNFNYLLSDSSSLKNGFELIKEINGYHKLKLNLDILDILKDYQFPIKIELKPIIFIFKRNVNLTLDFNYEYEII